MAKEIMHKSELRTLADFIAAMSLPLAIFGGSPTTLENRTKVRPMAKTLLSMADLRARALTEIRKQPGCSGVRDVAINHVTDDRAESNWSLSVVSTGAVDARAARRGAIYVQHTLRYDFDLSND
jgi:hypothetical protein